MARGNIGTTEDTLGMLVTHMQTQKIGRIGDPGYQNIQQGLDG